MPVPFRHVLHQGPMLGALARIAATGLRPKGAASASRPPAALPDVQAELSPPPAELVRAYVRHVGGDPAAYRGTLPPHLFPQWVFPVASRALESLPYPLARGLNAGSRMEIRAPLPADERLKIAVRVENVDENERRALIRMRTVTGTATQPEALIAHWYVLLPLGGDKAKPPNGAARADRKERPRVPDAATELARWRISAGAGLDFAKLTGDFNPVHWVAPYARASGFRSVILHGFSTMARAAEGLTRALHAGDASALRVLDVRFTRPLVLPHDVGLYLHDKTNVYVGDAPGGPAYLVGTFATEEPSR